jgi:hypothetical protein
VRLEDWRTRIGLRDVRPKPISRHHAMSAQP